MQESLSLRCLGRWHCLHQIGNLRAAALGSKVMTSTLHSKGRDTPQPGGRKHPRDLVVHKQFSKLTQRLKVLIWEPSTDRQEHPAVCSRRMCEGGRAGTREEITRSHPGRQCCHLQSTTGNPGRMPHCWDKMEPGSWASHHRTVGSRAHASCCPSPPHREQGQDKGSKGGQCSEPSRRGLTGVGKSLQTLTFLEEKSAL